MAKKLQDYTTEQLRKRKKAGYFMIGLLLSVFGVTVIVMVLLLIRGKSENVASLFPGIILFVFAMPMYVGVKKIDEELKRRERE